MSTPDRSTLESVEKLLAERRKVTGWLSALAARRDETSPVVYQRVRDDYTTKLEKVQAKLVAASDAVQVVAADVAGRLTDKEQALAARSDERAEMELRAAVGEFSEREWEKRRTRLDDDIAAATGERDALRDELGRLRAVLAEVAEAASDVVEDSAADVDPSHASEPSAAVAGTSDAPVAELTPPIDETPSPLSEREAASADAESSSAPTPVKGIEVVEPALPAIEIQEQSIIAPVEPALPLAPSFDELAFLKTVVGRPTPLANPRLAAEAPPAPELPRGPARESARETASRYAVPEPSVAFPDPVPEPRVSQEMTPPRESFFGRPTPRTSEAMKSLKCQECGTLNYPTEWYCERCGGELAAL